MRKLILIIILFNSILLASGEYELKLYEKIILPIFAKHTVFVYSDETTRKILRNSRKLMLTNECSKADVLIGKAFTNLSTECQSKPLFATSYRSFNSYKNSFGAFYWRKGRPQIKFNLESIESYNLFLPESLHKYAK